MISPQQVEQQCHKWWKELLIHTVEEILPGEELQLPFFPKEIRNIGKIKANRILINLIQHKDEIKALKANSKENTERGYSIEYKEKNFTKIGQDIVPDRIVIESLEDYLFITKREKEYNYFSDQVHLILSSIPALKEWIIKNTQLVLEHPHWPEAIRVCNYFIANPRPGLYARQLPIEVHTKFIVEENELLFRSLFDFINTEHICRDERIFEKRYHLNYIEPLIRIRFLDPDLSPLPGITDISICLSEFKNFSCKGTNVLVSENLMCFLCLPALDNTIALWSGGGFSVSFLNGIDWLQDRLFFYWGDIDAHGFQILNQFRGYYPNTKALMMSPETLQDFTLYKVEGKRAYNQELLNLSKEELAFYHYLKSDNIRLEQEKITQHYADEILKYAINKSEAT